MHLKQRGSLNKDSTEAYRKKAKIKGELVSLCRFQVRVSCPASSYLQPDRLHERAGCKSESCKLLSSNANRWYRTTNYPADTKIIQTPFPHHIWKRVCTGWFENSETVTKILQGWFKRDLGIWYIFLIISNYAVLSRHSSLHTQMFKFLTLSGVLFFSVS